MHIFNFFIKIRNNKTEIVRVVNVILDNIKLLMKEMTCNTSGRYRNKGILTRWLELKIFDCCQGKLHWRKTFLFENDDIYFRFI